jgi:hypothetical protein
MGSIRDTMCVCGREAVDGGGGKCKMCLSMQKAVASEAFAKAVLLHLGWEVALPADQSKGYDLVARYCEGGRWQNVQVKSTYQSRHHWVANTQKTNATGREKYRDGEVDLFAIVHSGPDGQELWLVPRYKVADSTRVRVSRGGLPEIYRVWPAKQVNPEEGTGESRQLHIPFPEVQK